MSVEIYNTEDDFYGMSELCVGVASERYFIKYWETAISDLNIHSLGNGVWLNWEEKDIICKDFEKVKGWAEINLPSPEAEYIISHVDIIIEVLSNQWESNYPRLWMG